MKNILSSLKPYLRWAILGGTLFFLAKAFKEHWREVAAIRIDVVGWLILFIAFCVTLIAHIWAGLVWGWILKSFKQPTSYSWVLRVYLKTNIAKYIPGNVWHYYGRLWAVTQAGGALGAATISVLLEPLLMAAAALLIVLIGSQLGWVNTLGNTWTWGLQILSLGVVLLAVHPRVLNPVLQFLSRLKGKAADTEVFQIEHYPFLPLLGEVGFLALRSGGFLITFLVLTTVNLSQILPLLSAFSLAWVLGLVIPTPGGLGVFESTAIALLNQNFPTSVILGVVALFRVVSILAEVCGALLAILCDQSRHTY
ncbi:MAG TPA: hypothetical protein DCE56_25040 [Cyanobacteria bacterium UBA8553]|nr:hypothetical protein [Cyanobacteria bacterium UBA8553]HAJ62866.1 hypothetical protein [Cyanobacteria bacterium UBA8543]